MKKSTVALLASLFLAPAASATVVTNNINLNFPPSGYTEYDLDGDGKGDLGLARSAGNWRETFIYGFGFDTHYHDSWSSLGAVIGASGNWQSRNYVYTPTAPSLPGLNYLAIRNTSIGNYFGYLTIDFRNAEQTLVSYTYEDSGAAIVVGGTPAGNPVPEPATLALLGAGLAAFGIRRRRDEH